MTLRRQPPRSVARGPGHRHAKQRVSVRVRVPVPVRVRVPHHLLRLSPPATSGRTSTKQRAQPRHPLRHATTRNRRPWGVS